jgi:hypothetical protein
VSVMLIVTLIKYIDIQLGRWLCRHHNSSLTQCYDCGKTFSIPPELTRTSEAIEKKRIEAKSWLQLKEREAQNAGATVVHIRSRAAR